MFQPPTEPGAILPWLEIALGGESFADAEYDYSMWLLAVFCSRGSTRSPASGCGY